MIWWGKMGFGIFWRKTFVDFGILRWKTFGDFGTFAYFCTTNQIVMQQRIFRRKVYDKMLEWKQQRAGKSALLLKGARRVGKSTIVSAFAEREYKSHIIIDFSKVSRDIINLFDNLMNMDYIFLRLQAIYHVVLETRKSVIVFDEVQLCPKARQAIKHFLFWTFW